MHVQAGSGGRKGGGGGGCWEQSTLQCVCVHVQAGAVADVGFSKDGSRQVF